MKDLLIMAFSFVAGVFGGLLPHVQRPLTECRNTLSKISAQIIGNTLLMYTSAPLTTDAVRADSKKLYDSLRVLHAQLLSSSSNIPRFARPILRLLGLLRSQAQIEEGARMLIGISNEVVGSNKDLPHLTECIKKLGKALDIAVSR